MAVFRCPQCGHSQAVDDKYIGKTATCPKCKMQAVVEELVAEQVVPATADAGDEPSIRRGQGKHIGIERLLENKDSTLRHEWIVIDDPRMTIRFEQVCGITPAWDLGKSTEYHRAYFYTSQYKWLAGAMPLTAVDFRFLTFDVWGSHVRTLCASTIRDVAPHTQHNEDNKWSLFSENEAWEHFASIAYVARVRTAEGKLINADADLILREAKRFSEKFTEADLEPKAPKKDS